MSFNGPDFAKNILGASIFLAAGAGYLAEKSTNKTSQVLFPDDEGWQVIHEIGVSLGALAVSVIGALELINSGNSDLAIIMSPAIGAFHLSWIGLALHRQGSRANADKTEELS